MARIIKVRCNGPSQCVNEVDIDYLLRPVPVVKGMPATPTPPERYVLPCGHCTQGQVIITQEMIAENP